MKRLGIEKRKIQRPEAIPRLEEVSATNGSEVSDYEFLPPIPREEMERHFKREQKNERERISQIRGLPYSYQIRSILLDKMSSKIFQRLF